MIKKKNLNKIFKMQEKVIIWKWLTTISMLACLMLKCSSFWNDPWVRTWTTNNAIMKTSRMQENIFQVLSRIIVTWWRVGWRRREVNWRMQWKKKKEKKKPCLILQRSTIKILLKGIGELPISANKNKNENEPNNKWVNKINTPQWTYVGCSYGIQH